MGQSRTTVFSHVTADSIGPQRFAHFQTKAHRVLCLLVGQSDVAVTPFASHLPSKPGRRLEPAACYLVREFHFRHYQTAMSATINIDLDESIFPGNFIPHLAQSSPCSPGPKLGELFWTELDLAFFPVRAATYLESERRSFAFFSETHLSACRFCRQITLLDNVMPRALQLIGQLPKQEFAFNFSIVSRLIFDLHKVRMLNAMDLLSRFSRRIGLTLIFYGNQGHSQTEFCSRTDAG